MKKVGILMSLIVLLVSCTQSKIGYVDVEEVMKDYGAAKLIEEQLKGEQVEMTRTIDSLMTPFQVKVESFYKNSDNMSASKRQTEEEALQRESQALQQQQQQVQQYLQQKGMAEIELLTKKIDSAVSAFGISHNYQMIIATQGSGQVMYGDDNSNVTEIIIDELNAEFELKQ